MITVEDIMTHQPTTVSPDTTLGEVIGLMKTNHFLHMPVVDEGKLVGIITDRDLRLVMNSPLVLHDRADDLALLKVATAGVAMTPKPLTISPDSPATLAAKLMRKHKFGALPVVDDGELVGIVSVSDILDNYITILEMQASAKTG